MFIKLRAKRFWGRLTVQERGAGLGDIFTQNTLSAIKAVCHVLGLSLCGQGGVGRGGQAKGGEVGAVPNRNQHTTQSSAAGEASSVRTHTHMHAATHTGFFFPAYAAQ